MKKPSVTLIGIFVLGAVALALIGAVALGAGRFFTNHPTFVMYFRGSVKGLSEGSSVVFKGVKVGRVQEIGLQYNPDTKSVLIIVLAEINLNTITRPSGEKATMGFFMELIRQGLKAQLQYQTFLTGQLLIDLDFHPGKPIRLARSNLAYPQIPTISSSLEELSKVVENLPLDELAAKLANAVESIARVTESPVFRETVRSINKEIDELRRLTRNINQNMGPLAAELRGAVKDSRRLIRNFDKRSSELMAGMEEATQATRSAVIQAEETLRSIESSGTKETSVMYQLSRTLEKISDAADSLRALSDYLSRHPEAVLRGKRPHEQR